ncbi:hypothetical protein LO78_10950, partial [Enterococcus faecium]
AIFFYYSTLFDSRFKTLQQNPPGNTLTKLIHTKFGVDKGIRTINLDQHGIDDATFLYQKWR